MFPHNVAYDLIYYEMDPVGPRQAERYLHDWFSEVPSMFSKCLLINSEETGNDVENLEGGNGRYSSGRNSVAASGAGS
jgi:hypothetical protein